MKWILLLALVAATTRPSSRPTTIDIKPFVSAVDLAEKSVDHAKADAVKRWEASDKCKAMTADLNQKMAARDAAKAGDDLQKRLDAAKAYNDSRLALKETGERFVLTDSALIDAQKARQRASRELDEAERHNREIADSDPIQQAIKKHKPMIGMTLDQMRHCLDDKGRIITEGEHDVLYDFSPYIPASGARVGYAVWFRDGKAVQITPP